MLAPALMMLCMLIIQFGLWFNARQVALAAAQAGATVARQEAFSNPNWGSAARDAAIQYYRSLHTHLLNSPTALPSGTRTTNVYVTVSGKLSYHLFPFFPLSLGISATAGGPVECFRPATTGGAAC